MTTKSSVCKKVWVSADGVESRTQKLDTEVLSFRYTNGKQIDVRLSDFRSEVQQAATWNGLAQKIGDAFAGCGGDADIAYEDGSAMYHQLTHDGWYKLAREGKQADSGVLVEALARFTKTTEAEAAKVIAGMDAETKKKLRKHKQLAPMIAKIEAERAAARAERLAEAASMDEEDDMDLGLLFEGEDEDEDEEAVG